MNEIAAPDRTAATAELRKLLRRVREDSLALTAPASAWKTAAQCAREVNATKEHLAHTTWFFEKIVLEAYSADYDVFRPGYDYLFSSYLDAARPKSQRALVRLAPKPTLDEVIAYRHHVDEALERLLDQGAAIDALTLMRLGCRHEQHHQELLLSGIESQHAHLPDDQAHASYPVLHDELARGLPADWMPFEGDLTFPGGRGTGFAHRPDGEHTPGVPRTSHACTRLAVHGEQRSTC